MLKDFKDGISAYTEAFSIISRQKLWGYVMVPGFLSIAYGIVVVLLSQLFSGNITDLVAARYPWEWGADLVRRLAGFISTVIIFAGALMAYKYVILVLVAPFMSPLSEKVESYLRGGEKASVPFSVSRMTRELIRGLRVSLRNIIRELLLTLILLIVGAIPVLGLLSAPAIFAVQSYYAGFGNMDYTMERHLNVRRSVEFVRDYKGLAVGNGLVFLLLLLIPFLGLFLAPSLATVAGTVETVKRLDYEEGLL
jgi:CysZ protein